MQVNRFSYYWLDTWVMANIAEGNSRHSTSKETEMRLSVPPGQVWRNWTIQEPSERTAFLILPVTLPKLNNKRFLQGKLTFHRKHLLASEKHLKSS